LNTLELYQKKSVRPRNGFDRPSDAWDRLENRPKNKKRFCDTVFSVILSVISDDFGSHLKFRRSLSPQKRVDKDRRLNGLRRTPFRYAKTRHVATSEVRPSRDPSAALIALLEALARFPPGVKKAGASSAPAVIV
jgi:hypothetical protein